MDKTRSHRLSRGSKHHSKPVPKLVRLAAEGPKRARWTCKSMPDGKERSLAGNSRAVTRRWRGPAPTAPSRPFANDVAGCDLHP
jgi:hypothetical protein